MFCISTLYFDFLLALPNTVPNTPAAHSFGWTNQFHLCVKAWFGSCPIFGCLNSSLLYVACFTEKIRTFVHAYHIHMPTQMLCSCSLKWSLGVLVGQGMFMLHLKSYIKFCLAQCVKYLCVAYCVYVMSVLHRLASVQCVQIVLNQEDRT